MSYRTGPRAVNIESGKQKSAVRSLLLNPVVVIIEAILLVSLVVGIVMSGAPDKDHYVGMATVDSVSGATKVCWLDLTTADGQKLKKFEMTVQTCKDVQAGDVIEVVRGKYKPGVAP